MASSRPLLLLLGAGPNVGQTVSKKFQANGYRVALAARSLSDSKVSDHEWSYKIDLGNPSAIEGLFSKVSKEVGIPNVVVYNAASLISPPGDHPFSVNLADFETALKINTTSTYAAAKYAVDGFDKLPESTLKSFIYTGNMLNVSPMPMLLTLGVGKAASAHIVESGASAYASQGYRFYYVDERNANGLPAGREIDGPAHADTFIELASKPEQGPWQWTFVKGKGYVKF